MTDLASLRERDEIIAAFVRERDEMLLACDVDLALVFHAKHNPNIPPKPREIVEISIHKARTAARSLPIEARLLSKRWLEERGYSSLDDGELSALSSSTGG